MQPRQQHSPDGVCGRACLGIVLKSVDENVWMCEKIAAVLAQSGRCVFADASTTSDHNAVMNVEEPCTNRCTQFSIRNQ